MQRFGALDGLRGIAALCVLAIHSLGHSYGGFPGGFLAVDFFFILSGFVLAHAYEHRWAAGLSLRFFAKIRTRRIYPTIAVGILLGGAVASISYDARTALAFTAAALLFIPQLSHPAGVFPTNGPQWSLFFELFANALHAAWLRRLSVPVLSAICATSYAIICMADLAYSLQMFGVLDRLFWLGFPRVLFGYTAGILIFRLAPQVRAPLWLLMLAVPAAMMAFPSVPGEVILLLFPFIVAAGAHARSGRACRWLGEISYPLYAVHYPIVTLIGALSLSEGIRVVAGFIASIFCAHALAVALRPRARLAPAMYPSPVSQP